MTEFNSLKIISFLTSLRLNWEYQMNTLATITEEQTEALNTGSYQKSCDTDNRQDSECTRECQLLLLAFCGPALNTLQYRIVVQD